jgi:hypothetical protein
MWYSRGIENWDVVSETGRGSLDSTMNKNTEKRIKICFDNLQDFLSLPDIIS